MKTPLSLGSLAQNLVTTARRFPVTVLLVAALAALCFREIHGEHGMINYRLWLFTGIGTLWSLAAALWAEERMNNLKTQLVTVCTIVIWALFCFLALPAHENDLQTPQVIRFITFGASALLATFFGSFFRKNTDNAFWNFTARTLGHTMLAGLFAGVILGGLVLALQAVRGLFDIDFSDRVFASVATVCFVIFAPLYLLSNIPSGQEKQDGELRRIPVLKILGLYILTPILALYALILYAYLFKILTTWELPDGWVSWLVTALALGGLLVITCLFPWRTQNRVVGLLSRWFGPDDQPLLYPAAKPLVLWHLPLPFPDPLAPHPLDRDLACRAGIARLGRPVEHRRYRWRHGAGRTDGRRGNTHRNRRFYLQNK